MISLTLKIAAARPINPIFEVFSRRCGISEITGGWNGDCKLLFVHNAIPRLDFCLR